MKIKRFDKKLSLKKSTIANLRNDEMNAAYGGATSGCVTWVPKESVCMICTGQCHFETDPC